MLRPSDTTLKILRYIQLQVPATVPEISKACGIKSHTVSYALRQLRDNGLLTIRPSLNHSRLGYIEYELYLRLPVSAAESRSRLLRWAAAAKNVTVLSEVGGEFQYEVVFIVRRIAELVKTFASLSAFIGEVSLERSMAVRTSIRMFGTKCLYPFKEPLPTMGYTCQEPAEDVTPLDLAILRAMDGVSEFNLSKLARQLAQPSSTVEYRLRRLHERNIVTFYYDYSALNETLGLLGFQLLIKLKGVATGFEEAFLKFCHIHPHIDNVQGHIGSWDFKLLTRVPSYDAVLRLVDELYARFEKRVADVRIVPMLKVHHACGFPEPDASEEEAEEAREPKRKPAAARRRR